MNTQSNSHETFFKTVKETDEPEKTLATKTTSSASVVLCSTCNKQVPKTNIELHKLKCTAQFSSATNYCGTTSKTKTKSKKKKNASKNNEKEEEDIDKLLETFNKVDNVCNGDGCKAKIATLGVTCEFCRRR